MRATQFCDVPSWLHTDAIKRLPRHIKDNLFPVFCSRNKIEVAAEKTFSNAATQVITEDDIEVPKLHTHKRLAIQHCGRRRAPTRQIPGGPSVRLKLFFGGCALCLALTSSTAFANNMAVPTPEPSSLALMGLGLIGFSVLAMLLRSKKSEDATS